MIFFFFFTLFKFFIFNSPRWLFGLAVQFWCVAKIVNSHDVEYVADARGVDIYFNLRNKLNIYVFLYMLKFSSRSDKNKGVNMHDVIFFFVGDVENARGSSYISIIKNAQVCPWTFISNFHQDPTSKRVSRLMISLLSFLLQIPYFV